MKTTTIVTKGLAPGSLFKLIFVGLAFSLGLFIIFMGILSLFGASVLESRDSSILLSWHLCLLLCGHF